jgi:NAD(P)-dependent dehydrogenase (short-subunit alcohol dehydrogenase family)
MLLENRNAVVYGGGGSIGGAVAHAFAREGATVHLAGRTASTLDAVAADIRTAGGKAETATVDERFRPRLGPDGRRRAARPARPTVVRESTAPPPG